MQYNASFHGSLKVPFQLIFFDIFIIFPPNIHCRYLLEPPQWGGSNDYRQSMFFGQNKKIRKKLNPVNPIFPYIKWGFPGCSLHGLVNVMLVSKTVLHWTVIKITEGELFAQKNYFFLICSWSPQDVFILSTVAGLSNLKCPVRPIWARAVLTASLMANRTEAERRYGGSPTPCKEKHKNSAHLYYHIYTLYLLFHHKPV